MRHAAPRNARGFTLIELLVSVAVLVGLMAMVAMVFSSASKSSGQAQATTAIYRVAGQLADSIRQDLAAMEPGQSILGVARVDVSAYETVADAETGRALGPGDVHRADVLMLVTQRPFEPYILQQPPGPFRPDERFEGYRHVVYEHANLGRLLPTGLAWDLGPPGWHKNVEDAVADGLPASRWHLARRVTGGVRREFNSTFGGLTNLGAWPLTRSPPEVPPPLVRGLEYTGEDPDPTHFTDVFFNTAVTLSDLIEPTARGVAPGIAKYNDTGVLYFYYAEGALGTYRQDGALYCLAADPADGRLYWWRRAAAGRWTRAVDGAPRLLLVPPGPPTSPPANAPVAAANSAWNWREWFYTGGLSRVRLDQAPPPGRTDRMAHYFLPGCSDFKVEFTYDDPREIDVDATSGEPILFDSDGDGTPETPTPQPIRWASVPAGETWVWSHLPVEPSLYDTSSPPRDLRDLTQPYRWPRAIRITLRVYDPSGQLPEPVTRTIIHTWP